MDAAAERELTEARKVRWLEVNTFTCPRIIRNPRISPEQCAANRERHDAYQLSGCERCTEWTALCAQVEARRFQEKKTLEEDAMSGLTQEIMDQTAAAMQAAATFGDACKALGIAQGTLRYRLGKSKRLREIFDEKGFHRGGPRRSEAGDPLPGAPAGKGETKDAPEGKKQPAGETFGGRTEKSRGIGEFGPLQPIPDQKTCEITIRIDGIPVSDLPALLQSLTQVKELEARTSA